MSHAEGTHSLPPAQVLRLEPKGHGLTLGVMVAGAAALLVAWLLGRGQMTGFAAAWLVAFLFWLTLALGGLFFSFVHHSTNAGWSVVVRRIAEAIGATLPLFVVLFVPLALGMGELFPWVGPAAGHGAHAALMEHKAPYLNRTGFLIRSGVSLLVWAIFGWWYWRLSLRQDHTESNDPARRLRTWSFPGLVIFAFTLTFASFDWIMSLSPAWYSTIFGVYLFAGVAVAGWALLSILVPILSQFGPLAGLVSPSHLHELGKLLFAWVVFWAYIAFSQYLLIWYANIPEETAWYWVRINPNWRGLTIALAVGHFVVPFFYLLSARVKRRPWGLAAISVWLLILHLVDLLWLVYPSVSAHGGIPVLELVLCLVGMGLMCAGIFWALLSRAPLVPVGDPRLEESLAFETM